MLIRSTFKDYYDTAAGMGVDSTLIYQRETKLVELEHQFFIDNLPAYFPNDRGEYLDPYDTASIEAWNQQEHCDFYIIGFCGTQIVCLNNTLPDTIDNGNRMAYFGEEILKLDWSKKKRYRQPSSQQVIEDCLHQFHGKANFGLFKQLNTPIFSISLRSRLSQYEQKCQGLYAPKFTINPNLAAFRFFKYKDAFTTFQEIQSYLSGVLGSPEADTIEVSDRSKIVKAGFDLKTSFRKRKQD
jgi:hypothetical protein